MKNLVGAVVLALGCTRGAPAEGPHPGSASASAQPQPDTDDVQAGPQHYKSGASGKLHGVTFTLRMLPKLIVSGTPHEIEQLQLEVSRGTEHSVVQVDTVNKRAEWGGLVFELGYADVYHDDIELTVHR